MDKVTRAKVDIGGKSYVIASDDDYLQSIGKVFEPRTVKLLKSVVRDCDVVLDIGANIGCTALLLGDLARYVYAFEPSRTTYVFLEQNISKSRKTNIYLHNIGLGDESGEFTLTFSPANRAGGYVSSMTQASEGHTVETIEIRRMDEVADSLGLKGIDFIKIDVEGYERHVLRGGQQTLSAFRPLVLLELNHWCLNALQRTSVPDFVDYLRSVFPILLAVDGSSYRDLHDANDTYEVMYYHIVHGRYPDILAGYDEERLELFLAQFKLGP